ncbi:hypothetical protein N9M41_05260 [Rhodopirellula sp.]|nr:hypothetical protein [Rhodopirellula sp.]
MLEVVVIFVDGQLPRLGGRKPSSSHLPYWFVMPRPCHASLGSVWDPQYFDNWVLRLLVTSATSYFDSRVLRKAGLLNSRYLGHQRSLPSNLGTFLLSTHASVCKRLFDR